jgi:benzodiazapine receptor
MITLFEILIILIPSVLGYGISMICPITKNAGQKVPFRPPSYVFAIVWPILFLLLGISMMLAYRKNLNLFWLYLITTVVIVSWTFFYGCVKNNIISMIILFISIILIGCCIFFSENIQRILMAFLLAWCIFASILNVYEVIVN